MGKTNNGKNKKISTIARKTYEMYKKDLENKQATKLKNDIKLILDKFRLDICSMDELSNRLEKIYFKTYCEDIKDYEIAKKKRLEKTEHYICEQIDNSIKQKKSYRLSVPELLNILMQVHDEINDNSYKVDINLLRPKYKDIAKKIVEERKTREVKQLFLVNPKDNFVIKGIINET